MSFFRKIFLSASALALCGLVASAQNVWQRFSDAVNANEVSFSYSYEMRSGTVLKGSGNADVQGDMFRISGNGMEIICDGASRWTVDRSAEEVVIESVESGNEISVQDNPALLVLALDKYFKVQSSSTSVEDGKKMTKVDFVPLGKMSFGMAAGAKSLEPVSLTVWFSDGVKPVVTKATVKMKDGSLVEIRIPSMTFSQKKPASFFRFDDSKSGSSWVVTDLR